MQKNNLLHEQIRWNKKWSTSPLTLFVIIATLLIVFLTGIVFGLYGLYTMAIVTGSLVMVTLLILRQDELLAAFIIVVHIYVDWYLGLLLAAQVVTLALL